VLAAQLASRGFSLSGGVRAGGSGVTGTLVVHRSRPLAQIAHALGKSSDNFCAEMLLKAVGAKASGAPGTTAAGIAAIEQYMKRIGAFGTGLKLWNGSGLYGGNRLSARSLVRALTAAYGDPRIGPELVASLAIGGTDGTLSQRFSNLRGERRLRAKTGTLADVVALAGYLLGPGQDRTIAFAILLNDVAGKTGEARRRIDSAVAALAS
jgi:D-alanyl-D-alanine carboxypeptidase/D-alanyl-D-alanine-endopeptidase (penicillin-binding protein 4)